MRKSMMPFISAYSQIFILVTPQSPRSTLFPYTTLFRSLYSTCVPIYRSIQNFWKHCTYYVCVHSMYSVDRKSTRLNSSHVSISYAVFCLKKKRAPLLVGRGSRDGDRRRQGQSRGLCALL